MDSRFTEVNAGVVASCADPAPLHSSCVLSRAARKVRVGDASTEFCGLPLGIEGADEPQPAADVTLVVLGTRLATETVETIFGLGIEAGNVQ